MRPKGVFGLVVVILLVVGITYLISDDLIETGMERSGESIIGARVEIDNLKFSLADLTISFDRLQVTNPNDTWRNVFETGTMSFNMEWAPLAAGKVIINDISVADIRLGTKRETDGKLRSSGGETESGWVGRAKSSLEEKIAAAPILNLAILKRTVNLDSLLATFDVQSLRRLNGVKSKADSTQEKWQTVLAEFDPRQDLEKIGREIQEIKPQEIKGVTDLVATFEKTKGIYSSLNDFKTEIEAKKTQAATDFRRLISSISSVDKWIARDFDSIKSKANLGEFSPQNIGTMIFGESIIQPIINLLPYIELIREYMPVAERLAGANRVESPPRFVGQDIRFPIETAQPDLLIEKVKISGATNQKDTTRVLRLRGEATGITSHPRLYGKPLTFTLSAQFQQSKTYEIGGEIDHTRETPREQFKVTAAGFQIGSVALPKRPYLPSVVNVHRADISTVLSLNGDDVDFQLEFTGRPVTFGFADSLLKKDAIAKVTTSVFRSVELLKVSTRIHGRIDDLDLAISTNIDNILANRIRGVIGTSAKVARGEIRKKLDAIVQPKRQEVLGAVNSYRKRTAAEINKIASGINEKLAVIDQRKREIENKIKKEKEKGLKGLTKKLTDIIKN